MGLSSEPSDVRIFLLLFNWHFKPRFLSVFKSRTLDGHGRLRMSKRFISHSESQNYYLLPAHSDAASWRPSDQAMENHAKYALNTSSYENATPHKSNICLWFTDELKVSLNTRLKICWTIPALFCSKMSCLIHW